VAYDRVTIIFPEVIPVVLAGEWLPGVVNDDVTVKYIS
jgi:hypothetical protein